MAFKKKKSFLSALKPAALPHSMTAEEILIQLDVRPETGLNRTQVVQRRKQYGANRLPDQPPRTAWLIFFAQFKSILIVILFGAAIFSALIDNVKDAVVILTVVLVNSIVGFYQE